MTKPPHIQIAGRSIGADHPPFIIAEMSANHLQDFDRAMRIVEMAAECGADAVKLQTYRADTVTLDHDGPGFTVEGGLWDGERLFDLYDKAHMPWDWHAALMARGRELGLAVFSTPFDFTAVDLLASLDAPAYKIASFECADLALVAHAARQGRPLIISTGMADLDEIGEAAAVAMAGGAAGVGLLHCVSGYPTPPADCNLRTIADLAGRFPAAVIGLSDHTLGTAATVAAVALGAAIIEKHVTLARADGGPDAAFSLEPPELRRLAADARAAWTALGAVDYGLKSSERGNAQFRRSLYVVADMPAGAPFSHDNVRSVRPGFGLAPKHLPRVVGRRATRDLRFGDALSADMIEGWREDGGPN